MKTNVPDPPNRTEKQLVRREHTRIIFGEGEHRWSVEDPDFPRVETEMRELTEQKLYYARGLASTLLYLVCTCPTTKRAQEQIALIRRALREIPNPYEQGENGAVKASLEVRDG